MAHSIILGMTESGKSTLALSLARRYKTQHELGLLVLDPLRDPRWQRIGADFVTDSQEEFLRVFWRSRSCACFLDEGGESVGRYSHAMQMTATRGRHLGHMCHYIAQRAVQLAPIVRDQCTNLFLFCSSAKDGALLAEEFNEPQLAECSKLKQGDYIHAVKFGGVRVNKSEGKNDDSGTSGGRSRGGSPGRVSRRGQEKGAEPGGNGDASGQGEGEAQGAGSADG